MKTAKVLCVLVILFLVMTSCAKEDTPPPPLPTKIVQVASPTFPSTWTPDAGLESPAAPSGTVIAMAESPTPLPATDTPTPPPTPIPCGPPPGWVAYRVLPGDTLFSLARKTGTTVQQVQWANCLEGTIILAGQALYLPFAPPPPTVPPPPPVPPPEPPTAVPPAPEDPDLFIEPSCGLPGQVFTITLEYFQPSEEVRLEFRFESVNADPFRTITVTVDMDGRHEEEYSSQSDDGVGIYIVRAIGRLGSLAEEYFWIEDNPSDCPPTVLVEPPSGPVGTTYTLTLQGFEPDEAVTISLAFLETDETLVELLVVVDETGRGVFEIVSQPTDPVGKYVVFARGEAGSFAQGRLRIDE